MPFRFDPRMEYAAATVSFNPFGVETLLKSDLTKGAGCEPNTTIRVRANSVKHITYVFFGVLPVGGRAFDCFLHIMRRRAGADLEPTDLFVSHCAFARRPANLGGESR